MDKYFKILNSWDKELRDNPAWYQIIMPILFEWEKELVNDPQKEEIKSKIYQFFADKLESEEIILAKKGPNFDEGRLPIDTAIIHHTSNQSSISQRVLSAIGLLRQYANDYYQFGEIYGHDVKDQPIWSGHFKKDKPVFYAYHWLVRMDGTLERLLEDQYLGWHAGNGDINKKSIGIVLDGDFIDSEPSSEAVQGIAKLLKENYPGISLENIFGHLEVNLKTECPGKLFLPNWKNKILQGLGD